MVRWTQTSFRSDSGLTFTTYSIWTIKIFFNLKRKKKKTQNKASCETQTHTMALNTALLNRIQKGCVALTEKSDSGYLEEELIRVRHTSREKPGGQSG